MATPSPQVSTTKAQRSPLASGAVCAGSNPAGGTLYEVPKDPVTSGKAEAGVFAYVQADVTESSSTTVIT